MQPGPPGQHAHQEKHPQPLPTRRHASEQRQMRAQDGRVTGDDDESAPIQISARRFAFRDAMQRTLKDVNSSMTPACRALPKSLRRCLSARRVGRLSHPDGKAESWAQRPRHAMRWGMKSGGCAKTTISADDGSHVWEGRMGEANEATGQGKTEPWGQPNGLVKIQDVTTEQGRFWKVGA